MYQQFFSLNAAPFSISPDPDFLFLSDRHKEALAHLQHGLKNQGGFLLLTGEVGTGKTMISRCLLESIDPQTHIASVLNPALSDVELLETLCDQFAVFYQDNHLVTLFSALQKWLIANYTEGQSAIVVIDEAQHLSLKAFEQLLALTRLEIDKQKILQVILIGQTELQTKLKEPEFRLLAQNIIARYHLLALTNEETHYYIIHRLNKVGAKSALFDKKALDKVFKITHGIPRLVNILCDRSLLSAFASGKHRVSERTVSQSAKEFKGSNKSPNAPLFTYARIISLTLLIALSVFQMPHLLNSLGNLQVSSFFMGTQDITPPAEVHSEPVKKIEKEPIKAVKIQQWFADYPALDLSQTRFNEALSALYSVWGYHVQPKLANCSSGKTIHLSCYQETFEISRLIALNYPAVIELKTEKKAPVYAVLYKIEGNSFKLLIKNQLIDVPQSWLSEYWTGEATLLWRAPFELKSPLQVGQKSQKVAWLIDNLSQLQGWTAKDPNNTRFNVELLEHVVAFQRDMKVDTDGIVGKFTIMMLMPQVTTDTPRLIEGMN
ncbi:MAG TPA: AAA family ATPase [Psychromonas hadalis]|nr:AAA family ATPase [Psychromonas hadalis]